MRSCVCLAGSCSKSKAVQNTDKGWIEDECIVQDDDANFNASDSWDDLMKGCPLRELPSKKNWGEIFNGNVKGWNDCLREITGENNNE